MWINVRVHYDIPNLNMVREYLGGSRDPHIMILKLIFSVNNFYQPLASNAYTKVSYQDYNYGVSISS